MRVHTGSVYGFGIVELPEHPWNTLGILRVTDCTHDIALIKTGDHVEGILRKQSEF